MGYRVAEINDVIICICYYNLERFHTANGDLSPLEYEKDSLKNVS